MVIQAFLVSGVNAAGNQRKLNYTLSNDGKWWKVQTDLITIMFPAGGKKPMFLWWYTNDTSNIHVVKYKGLIEYLTLDFDYYRNEYVANNLTIQERLEAKYAMSKPEPHRTQIRNRIRAYFGWLLGFHPAFLPFSACRWNLTGPENVTREDGVSYISFNFTLVDAPPTFDFAEGNVIIRCRFYATDAAENVCGLYDYTAKAGELKMDLIIKGWDWNTDKLNSLFEVLQNEFGLTVPKLRAGLALLVDLASINAEKLQIAEQDVNTPLQTIPEDAVTDPAEPVGENSGLSNIIAGGQKIQIRNRITEQTDALNVRTRLHERFRLRFANESQTLAGFFDFVNTAVVINTTTQEKTIVNVTAAYMPRGNYVKLFIGYPYFGDGVLEHDPSIGVEEVVPWLSIRLPLILLGVTAAIVVVVVAVKVLKKPINVLTVK
ncbi:MAG: hypothetical protein QXI91_04285 [Candidatus Bathyarchaeia archaeon]